MSELSQGKQITILFYFFLKWETVFCVTHLMWGRVRWHGARGRDRGFSRGKAEALSRVWRCGKRAGSGARLQAFRAGPGRLGLLGEHRLAGRLGWGGGWCRESWGYREIKKENRYHNLSLVSLKAVNPHSISSDDWRRWRAQCSWRGWGATIVTSRDTINAVTSYNRRNAYLIHQALRTIQDTQR